jgi:RimJ/RimL family protein N-acetyltransferase
MYATFEPKLIYFGLPPAGSELIERWLHDVLDDTQNANLVLTRGERVIGHAALLHYPATPGVREIAIFVHQDHRSRGIGRRLFLAAMHHGCHDLGLGRVWLWVNRRNVRGLRLYSSVGFVATEDSRLEPEIVMHRSMSCRRCREDECPVFTSDLARQL